MKRLQRISNPGFTLVEMLVVISIIGILAGLVTVGAMAAIKAAKRALITTELSQLDMGLQNFRSKFNAYPPDGSIYKNLDATLYDADGNGIPDEFEQFFRTAFPNALLYDAANGKTGELDILKTKYGVTGKGYDMFFIDPQTKAPLYTPQTAMVFWLGGMPEDPRNPNSTLIGFSNNRINPLSDTTSTSRLGPFYDAFKPENLRNPPNATTSLLFRAYLAPVKTSTEEPIVYFRAEPGQRGNEYYVAGTVGNNPRMKAAHDMNNNVIRPYYDTRSSAFVNRSSFQILCAGLDGQFFTNNPTVTAANPDNRFLAFPTGVAGGNANLLPYDNANLDDQTNFIKGTIGDEMQ
jgi:prepilin-type N-terminal cleavage/methylation domain-containing protein